MMRQAASRWLTGLRAQWTENRRLRWGLWAIGVILFAQGLFLLGDAVQASREQASSLRDEIDRVRPLMREKAWSGRADDARQQLDALRSMLWPASDLGLAEASMQDWVRATAGKAGLSIRELAVSRPVAAGTVIAASGPTAAAGPQPVRVRLVVDLNRLPLMGFLAELARNEKVVVVDRLMLRPAAQPALVEIELRALVALRAEAR